jgi:ABC-type amino acid transport system permease subunit
MWDWIKAMFDGGITWLIAVMFVTCLATGIYRHARDWRRETWEEAVVLAVVLLLFCANPLWHLVTDSEWHRFAIGEEPSAFTYGKMLWVDFAGVVLGRLAYTAVPAWFLRT